MRPLPRQPVQHVTQARGLGLLLFLSLTFPAPELVGLLAGVGAFVALYGHAGKCQTTTVVARISSSQNVMSMGASRV